MSYHEKYNTRTSDFVVLNFFEIYERNLGPNICFLFLIQEPQDDISLGHRPSGHNAHIYKERGSMGHREPLKPYDSETSQATSISRGHSVFTVPVQVSASSGFEWAKHQNNEDAITTLSSKSQISAIDQSNLGFANNTISLTKDEDRRAPASHAKGQDQYETSSRSMQMRPTVHSTANSFDLPDIYYSQDFPTPTFNKEEGFGHGNDQVSFELMSFTP